MDITLDIPFIRSVLADESAAVRDDLRHGDAVRALEASQRRHDQRIAAAADVRTLACGAGCSWCCHFTVDVRAAEVFRILDVVERSFTPAQRERLLAEVGANSEALRHLDADQRATRNLRCPFLVAGRCSIYAARPQTCRNYHATDAAGCRQSYEEPGNLDIDPEFAPGVYQAGLAHVEAVSGAMAAAGLDVRAYELNGALAAALADPAARERFESGQAPFPHLQGAEVESEFDDL